MNYFQSKLSDILFRISIHEGNANMRLASEAPKILFQLATHEQYVPDRYKRNFRKLIDILEETVKELSPPGLVPIRLKRIQNRTAAKYIKLLIDIQNELKDQLV